MSVWRSLLQTILPWAFKAGEAAAAAAVNKQDVGKAAGDAVKGIENDKALQDTAQAALDATVIKVTKDKK